MQSPNGRNLWSNMRLPSRVQMCYGVGIQANDHDTVSIIPINIVPEDGHQRGIIVVEEAMEIVKTLSLHATTRTVGVQVDHVFVKLQFSPSLST